jgi:hypothetical protein
MEGQEITGAATATQTFSLHWAEGATIPGVTFSRASHVRIIGGAFADECASVRDLVCVDPEPCYRVEVDSAKVTLEVAQSSLDRI